MRTFAAWVSAVVLMGSACQCGGPTDPDGGSGGGSGGNGGSGGSGGSGGWSGPDGGSGGFCTPHWCWEFPLPQGNNLTALTAVNGDINDVWAVGSYGTVLHWNGAAWSVVPFPNSNSLSAVSAAGPNDLWVSGLGLDVHRWNGTAWSSAVFPGSVPMNSLHAAQTNDVWAVGGPAVLRYLGAGWTRLDAGTGLNLELVHGSAPDNVWSVGASGAALHFDGVSLQSVAVPDAGTVDFTALFATGPGAAVAFGAQSAVHFSGGGAQVRPLPVSAMTAAAISGVGPDDLWGLASGSLLRFDGGSWTSIAATSSRPLRALDVRPGGGWAVGDRGALLRLEGQSWSTFSDPRPSTTVSGLHAISPTEAFASAVIPMRYDGREWVVMPGGTPGQFNSSAVHGTSGSDIWFTTTSGRIFHWDGGSFSPAQYTGAQPLNAVFARAPNDVWAVGHNGTVLHFDGSSWEAVTAPDAGAFRAVWAASPSEVWVVGDNTALKKNGNGWDEYATDAGGAFLGYAAIWGSGPSDVIFATSRGLQRWDGVSLHSIASPGPAQSPIVNVWGAGPNDYYVSHFSRGIYRHHLDGGWESLPIPTFFSANALTGAGNRVWAGNLLGIFSR